MGFFSNISDLLSGIDLDEVAQNIVDEINEISEAINESNLTGQGSTLPMSEEPFEDLDSNETEEGNDTILPEEYIPIANPQDNICTNNPDDTSCDKKIDDAYFAHKTKKAVPSDEVGSYTFNNGYTLLKDNISKREKVIDDILKYLVKNKLGNAYANDTTKANIDTALPYEKLGRGVPITFDVCNQDTQETTSHSTTITNSAGKYDGRKTIPTKKREGVVKYIVIHIKVPNDGSEYITTKKDVEDALTKKVYEKDDVVENIKLYKVIDDYTKTTEANLGSKVYLVAKTKNFRAGTSVKFKIFESGDTLLSDYVNENNELPFLLGTNEKTEVMGQVITADVDNPTTGNALEGRVAIEIALRPKKDKPDNDTDTSANFEDWKKKFKKANASDPDKTDKLYLKVSTTSYPEVSFEENELVLKGGKECVTVGMLNALSPNLGTNIELLNSLNKYCEKYEVNTPLRMAHFLAQVAHESGTFSDTSEGTNYSHNQAKLMFSKYSSNYSTLPNRFFPNSRCLQPNLFNYVYGNRNGNGNEASGDGYTFRGRGFMQLTGRSNYELYTRKHNHFNPDDIQDFENNPNLVSTNIDYAVESAFIYWKYIGSHSGNRCNHYADIGVTEEAVKKVGAVINGWYTGKNIKVNGIKVWVPNPNPPRKPAGHSDRWTKFQAIARHLGLI